MERVYVTVRSRPLSFEDAKSSPWRISANSISYQNNPSCKFEFDRIFGEECKTREVYEARTKEIVSAAVRGFNGTVFAYGQTNSGKTHTMRGSANEPGIIPLAVHELFETIQEATDREFLLRMSYLEIYNEEINDLLTPQHRRLQIHESVERGIFVAGLSEEIVASPEQVLDLMEFGESHRHIGETNMNLYSSRSHTIFRMIIESRDRPEEGELENTCDAVRVSILNLVDLAGSERAAKTGAEGVRLKEGSHINKSLMTLGTVIKKLSEGAESQGGHVPYRDSKLTRILQSSLGGNANTAIICNITLAQIHADETKSSLQFASRALRITNCAHVNEILTDAALLKRQKKEIEELRAKLQASHSEHLEEEILSLRNTLLQTELERERIALELEEEKRSQVEREKRLEEQAKRIKNLSSMVLYANRDETRERHKRDKRRDTWCPGKLILDSSRESSAITISMDSIGEIVRPEREVGPLLPFGELVDESEAIGNVTSKQGDAVNDIVPEEITLDSCTLSKVTSRRKGPSKKKNVLLENHELLELKADYEELLMEFEAQRIMYEVEIDCLRRKIVKDNLSCHESPTNFADNSIALGDKSIYPRDLEAIRVIKNLQDQIKELEREKSLSQQYFDSAVEIAKEQNFCAMQERELLQKELTDAKLEAKLAHNQFPILEDVGNLGEISTDLISELLSEVEHISGEFQSFQNLVQSSSLVTDDLFRSYSSMLYLFSDLRSSMGQNLVLLKEISNDYQKQKLFFENKVTELVDEKLVMQNESASLYKQIDELTMKIQKSEEDLADVSEGHNLEKAELMDGLRHLEREVSCLSSSSLFREKESLRKDLEKTRAKLKDTESKLKNAIHDKTRIEGEKANTERQIKKLSNLNALLERDISRRESLAGRRRESTLDKRSRGHNNDIQQTLEDYKNLEVLAFEMERTIASLEEELEAVKQENEDIASRNESLSFEMEVLSEKLSTSSSELVASQDKTLALMSELEKSKISLQTLECKVQQIVEEKEELAMQMTHAFLELEEERAIWSAKEKASMESITEKTNKYTGEIMSLSTELSTTRNEILSLKEECRLLQLKLKDAEDDVRLEKMQSKEKSLEIDQLKHDLEKFQCEIKNSEQLVKSKVDMLQQELEHVQMELLVVSKEREELQFQIKDCEQGSSVSNDSQGSLTVRQEKQNYSEAGVDCQQKICVDNLMKAKSEAEELEKRCSDLVVKMHNESVENSKDRAKLRMRLRATQTKLDAFYDRYKEAVQEQEIMDSKFKEASKDLKRQLASCATEVLNLKKQLVASGSTQVG